MPVFDLNDVTIRYDEHIVLANINLRIEAGERIALLGESGAGKSSLLRYFYEHSPNECAWAPQTPALSAALSVYHNVYMGRLNDYPTWRNLWNLVRPFKSDVTQIKAVLSELKLEEECFNIVNTLSGGQQQRTGLARALYQKKPILLADEPVSAIDEYQAERIIQLLQSYSETVILGLHDSYLALNHSDRIIGLKDGAILIDEPSKNLELSDLKCLYQ